MGRSQVLMACGLSGLGGMHPRGQKKGQEESKEQLHRGGEEGQIKLSADQHKNKHTKNSQGLDECQLQSILMSLWDH